MMQASLWDCRDPNHACTLTTKVTLMRDSVLENRRRKRTTMGWYALALLRPSIESQMSLSHPLSHSFRWNKRSFNSIKRSILNFASRTWSRFSKKTVLYLQIARQLAAVFHPARVSREVYTWCVDQPRSWLSLANLPSHPRSKRGMEGLYSVLIRWFRRSD